MATNDAAGANDSGTDESTDLIDGDPRGRTARSTPGEHDGTRVQTQAGHSIDPPTRAYIHILRGLGLQHVTIASELDMSRSVVRDVLAQSVDRVDDGEDPVSVWVDIVAPLYENDPDAGVGVDD
jgi:hypothetical protein